MMKFYLATCLATIWIMLALLFGWFVVTMDEVLGLCFPFLLFIGSLASFWVWTEWPRERD